MMRRLPLHVLVAIAGLLLITAGVLTILAADPQQSANPIVPTVQALLTQMPPEAVIAQLEAMGYPISPEMVATAQAMLQQMPLETVMELMFANMTSAAAPVFQPVQPTATVIVIQTPVQTVEASPVQPTLPFTPTPAVETPQTPAPDTDATATIPPTTVPDGEATAASTPEQLPPELTASLVPAGRITGSVLRAEQANSSGIALLLIRPDGSTLNLPTGADGLFAFLNMEPGAYQLQASAAGFLSGQAAFTLQAGEDLALPPFLLQAGDTNGDNRVDLADAVMLAANFNAPPPAPEADLNQDGWIDVRDLALLGSAFGMAGPLPWG